MHNIIPPKLDEIEKRISEIENVDLQESNIDHFNTLFSLLFRGYKLGVPRFNKGLELYRGIPYLQKPKKLDDLSYPPIEYAKINRASREGKQIFYCSNLESVPFFELNLQVGERLVVSKWKTTRKLLVNNVGYADKNFETLKSGRKNGNWWDNVSHIDKKNELDQNFIIRNYLASKYSRPIPPDNIDYYKFTIAIAEHHFSSEMFDGLIYPTIQMHGNADNFAIKKSYVDSGGLAFLDVYYIEITEVLGFKYNIKRLDWANSVSENGEINWKGRIPQWNLDTGQQLKFTAKESKWVATDKDGNIIEPK
jgi:hypothetical protein